MKQIDEFEAIFETVIDLESRGCVGLLMKKKNTRGENLMIQTLLTCEETLKSLLLQVVIIATKRVELLRKFVRR